MNGAFDIGAVALRAQQRALDTIANNVANVNTPTYKRVDSNFTEVMARQAQPVSQTALLASQDYLPTGGVRFAPREMVFHQGDIRVTGNRLDLAIEGAGFIELMAPDGQLFLWRGGTLKVRDDGLLASDSGHALQANITVPDDATNLEIMADGTVKADLPESQGVELGRLSLVRVTDGNDLDRLDRSLYRPAEGARLIDAAPGEDGAGLFAQGRIENSNVDLSEEMVDLLTVQRAFAASAQIIQAADQLAGITNSLKR
jgi:flagellar basal-body rod protein FlgG